MLTSDKCLSPHVPTAQHGHTRLRWHKPYRTLVRTRPVAWTCYCQATVYELCEGGGQAFLRRTVQLDGKPEVHETSLRSIRTTKAIWTELLSGRAR
ncbi:hypothetical protein [Nonomuraea sp. NPDC005692]|uniref:hypothetical protein n=1 Tax=Nonomuraea sp. NPDC005692 TaxID=3157168 RepID=UPI0033EF3B0A